MELFLGNVEHASSCRRRLRIGPERAEEIVHGFGKESKSSLHDWWWFAWHGSEGFEWGWGEDERGQ